MSATEKQTVAVRDNRTANKAVQKEKNLISLETGGPPLLVEPEHDVFNIALDVVVGHNICLTGPTGNGKSAITRAAICQENYPALLAGSRLENLDVEIHKLKLDLSVISAIDEIYSKEKIFETCSKTIPVLLGRFCEEYGEKTRDSFDKLQKDNKKALISGRGKRRIFVIELDDICRVILDYIMNFMIPVGDGFPEQYLQTLETTRYLQLQLIASTNRTLTTGSEYSATKPFDKAHHNRFVSHYWTDQANVVDILKEEFPEHQKEVEALCRIHADCYRAMKNGELENLGDLTLRQLRGRMIDILYQGLPLQTAMQKMILKPLQPDSADYMNAERILARHIGEKNESRIHESFKDLFEL